ncbi:MAG TPA: hypothetical protein DHW64_10155 [Chitinophagaceae bacterium]|nr:hypothetical protein [Chitinophagaceae bacterium]
MKKIALFLLLLCVTAATVFSQEANTLQWQVSSKKVSEGVFDIIAKTTVPAGWVLYGLNPSVEGLESLKFSFSNENIKLAGTPVAEKKQNL